MSDTNRVLIIGLDGATWTVLGPWMEDGSLPNLARLRREGAWGELRSTIPPLTAPAWSTFLTGKNPGKHGVFHFIPLDDDPDSAAADLPQIVDSRSIQSATLWDILGHHGRKVGVINVPMSYPARPVNGFMVTCLLTPPHATVFSYPPELSKRLTDYQIDLDRFIEQKPFARDEGGATQKRIVKPDLQLMEEFYEMEEKRARTTLALMESEPWDVFMVVFTATDRMGHYLWPYHLGAGPEGSPDGQALHEAVYRFYKRLDEHVGELIEKAGPGAHVVVMSDHGMGPIFSKNTHWNDWLYKAGYLRLQKQSKQSPDGWLLRLGIPRDKLRRWLMRVPGIDANPIVQKARTAQTAQVDTKTSKAYYVRIFDPVGGIVINEIGAAKEALRDELIEAIREVKDPGTGNPVVRWVMKREDCFTGPYAGMAPDIIIVMHPEYGSSDRVSHYSSIVSLRPHISDPGGHHIEGILIAHGPKIRQQEQAVRSMQIEDIAPTVLYLMGLPIPSDMDGRALTEIIRPDVLDGQPVLQGAPFERWPSNAEAVSILEEPEGDEKLIYERLRALGYME